MNNKLSQDKWVWFKPLQWHRETASNDEVEKNNWCCELCTDQQTADGHVCILAASRSCNRQTVSQRSMPSDNANCISEIDAFRQCKLYLRDRCLQTMQTVSQRSMPSDNANCISEIDAFRQCKLYLIDRCLQTMQTVSHRLIPSDNANCISQTDPFRQCKLYLTDWSLQTMQTVSETDPFRPFLISSVTYFSWHKSPVCFCDFWSSIHIIICKKLLAHSCCCCCCFFYKLKHTKVKEISGLLQDTSF